MGLKSPGSVVTTVAWIVTVRSVPVPISKPPSLRSRTVWLADEQLCSTVHWLMNNEQKWWVPSGPNHLRAGVQPSNFPFPWDKHEATCEDGEATRRKQPRLLNHCTEECCPGEPPGPVQPLNYWEISSVISSYWFSGGFGWCSSAKGNPTPSDTTGVSGRQVINWRQDLHETLGVGGAQINSGRCKTHFTIEERAPQHSTRQNSICKWNKN